MLNDPRSHGLWEATAPAAPATQGLREALSADVVVVGGGFTGLSTALHLAQAGKKVVLLEAVEAGFGGAGRNVGLVNAGMWVMPDDLPKVLGSIHGDRLLHLLGNAPSLVFDIIEKQGISCEAIRNGTLHLAAGEAGLAELKQREAQWAARGAPVTLLSAEETAKKVGTKAYVGSLLDMRAGTIQPLAYARGLAQAAIAAGAKIFTSSAVTSIERQGSQWLVATGAGSVTADWVVHATDAYSKGPLQAIRDEQVHLPYFNLATKPLTPEQQAAILPERQGAWDTATIMTSFRFDQRGRLVWGSIGALRGTGLGVHRAWAKRAIAKLFPQLGKVEFEQEWFGWIGMTADNLPRFHKLGDKRVGFSGYNGRGIAPGTVFGKTLADLILGKIGEADLPLPVTEVATPSFRPIREAFYEVGAQVAHLTADRF
ncbi:NAD(P)/FAD-dependent oxidoreductase [Lacibacterium aquatile]|uniref:NAD(P)/FAD-dependent oxidoreductase n=1 Tax=Lacibacterium aquatile TaxID=1168082 RepID=A0ABW5DQZ6_9PROT